MNTSETFISVDIEASGPIPGEFSMLSLGACIVGASEQSFYVELKPITVNYQPEALKVAGFDLDDLASRGAEPAVAMARFEEWLKRVTPFGQTPVFVGYPLAFDWMFVAYYFHRFLGRNPFGITGVDLKSSYFGMSGAPWSASGVHNMPPQFADGIPLTHNAREDAIAQAEVFARILAHRNGRKT
jgi:DNA polymerase III epsilon subunit-like protein